MSAVVVAPEVLVGVVKEITQELLWRRFKKKTQCYIKIDFQILECDENFYIRITKCSSGNPNFKKLFASVMRNQLADQKLDEDFVIATIDRKLENTNLMQKVIYSGKSFKLIDDEATTVQKEFSLLKFYISVKLLFQVKNIDLEVFSNLLLSYFKEIEKVDQNIKILFRKHKQYIYRNRVRMDDIILSCKILSSSCFSIFKNSQSDSYRKDLMDLLGIKNPNKFEESVGCLLLAQVNKNFKQLSFNSKKES